MAITSKPKPELEKNFAIKLVANLVDKGYVLTQNTTCGKGYRTINKTEQRKLKVSLGV